MTQNEYRRREWESLGLANGVNCRYCFGRAIEGAHIVEASKRNIAKYGFHAVYNRANLVPTCRNHNDRAMNEARGPAAEEAHMKAIREKLIAGGII